MAFLPLRPVVRAFYGSFCRWLLLSAESELPESEKLKKENLNLKLTLKKYELLETENLRLKKALNFKENSRLQLLGAGIISFSPSSWDRSILIAAGSRQGIKDGMMALDEEGRFMGRIDEVWEDLSRVILASDPNFNLTVFIGSQGLGLLKGNLKGARILYVENISEINPGDDVWIRDATQGFSIEVGKVRSVSRDKDSLFLDLEAQLSARDKFLNMVFIVK